MPEKFKVQINEANTFELTTEDSEKFDLIKIENNKYHVIHNNKSVSLELIKSNFNERKYSLKINGRIYKSKIFNELDMLIEEMGFEIGADTDINNISAPMPGLILEISVKEGEDVKENQPILILEAMKMENVLVAPKDTTIKSIKVKKGQTVDKNDLLVEFE